MHVGGCRGDGVNGKFGKIAVYLGGRVKGYVLGRSRRGAVRQAARAHAWASRRGGRASGVSSSNEVGTSPHVLRLRGTSRTTSGDRCRRVRIAGTMRCSCAGPSTAPGGMRIEHCTGSRHELPLGLLGHAAQLGGDRGHPSVFPDRHLSSCAPGSEIDVDSKERRSGE